MKKILIFLSFISIFTQTVAASSEQCQQLKSSSIYQTDIYKAEWVEKSAELPAYFCFGGGMG
ncbi:hypothetical protein ACERCG_06180 [Mannheimia sp. E30BD]|uniref:hypothetical protein n=1 Tax=Mannheimia sp. E30BD TaxID=3278708 RepID=UPI00359E4B0F